MIIAWIFSSIWSLRFDQTVECGSLNDSVAVERWNISSDSSDSIDLAMVQRSSKLLEDSSFKTKSFNMFNWLDHSEE
jgi:hypothetical protein